MFCRALVACLNSQVVQRLAEHQHRVYGAGLIKFEPKDLLSIQVPSLINAPEVLLRELADMLRQLDAAIRQSREIPQVLLGSLDALVEQVATTTSKS